VVCGSEGLDSERILRETDASELMEGLYVKVEEGGCVVERYKLVREIFLQAVDSAGDHWLERRLIPNQLRPGVDLFAEEP
jgi:hypothetical protein